LWREATLQQPTVRIFFVESITDRQNQEEEKTRRDGTPGSKNGTSKNEDEYHHPHQQNTKVETRWAVSSCVTNAEEVIIFNGLINK
jgi:hypothetical protein